MKLTWLDGPNSGGIDILDYRVSYKELDATEFTELATGLTVQSFLTSGLTLGTTYVFIVESRNELGYSDLSTEFEVLHALIPDSPIAPSTSNSDTDIVFSWTAPNDNGGTISSYSILIRRGDGIVYLEDAVNCNGADSTIVSTTSCTLA